MIFIFNSIFNTAEGNRTIILDNVMFHYSLIDKETTKRKRCEFLKLEIVNIIKK